MKKFILKIMLYVGIIFGIIMILNLRWTSTEVYLMQDEKYKTLNPPNTINVCNVGTSHGMMGFEYSCLPEGYTGFNFGRPVQTFYYDLQMLKQNKNRLEQDCVVYIPISYFSFYQRYDDPQFLEGEYVYYNFLKFKYIRNPSLKILIEYKWLPILSIHKDQLKYLIHDDKGALERYEASFEKNKLINGSTGLIDEERLITERNKTLVGHTEYFDEGINSEAVDALKEMLDYCGRKGYRCILITTPFSQYYNDADAFDEEFMATFSGMINEIATEYEVPYWDYSHDERFTGDIYLFYDDDHLNHKGRKLFSEIVLQRAIDEGYLDISR